MRGSCLAADDLDSGANILRRPLTGQTMRKVLYILGELSDDDVEWLAAHGSREKVKQGHILVTQGKPLSCLYFILDGQFEVSVAGGGRLALVGCGEIIGEISMIDGRPPTATVSALSDGVVLALERSRLQKKLAADIAFAAHFYRAVAHFLAERMRATVQRIGSKQAQDVELDESLLDNVHLAGARFDRILKRFQG
ncbi:cyclic nucleotide-binding domain-containing protein [Massilia sp. W12]|uniref:cyclic nucleotide-binding domain-containing protein n=1 Tax=Massilia sp. W12 TaxID=3126507 RepID=UPI0030D458FE